MLFRSLDRKMNNTFFDGHDELYHHAKFGEDHTTRAGCRCENVVFFLLVTLRVRYLLTVRSRGAYFEQALRCRLLPDFDAVCSVFEEGQHGRMVGECNHGDVCECTDSS